MKAVSFRVQRGSFQRKIPAFAGTKFSPIEITQKVGSDQPLVARAIPPQGGPFGAPRDRQKLNRLVCSLLAKENSKTWILTYFKISSKTPSRRPVLESNVEN
ncbi:MAG: hypothetical protein ABIH35_04480 [Patescibacteria group bacterium]